MIKSFSHKGLQEFFEKDATAKLPQERLQKIRLILSVIHSAHEIRDLRMPSLRLHRLKSPPFRGFYSIDISGNYRIIFEWDAGHAYNLNYLDTH